MERCRRDEVEACPRVADDVLALVDCALRLQSEHPLLHLAILSLQLLKRSEQRLEVLGRERVSDGCRWRRALLLLLTVVLVQGRFHDRR